MSGLIVPSRRGFLGGLAALVAAPLVVRASSLMPVANVDHLLYPFRGITQYCIGTDELLARVDVAYGALPVPKGGVTILTETEIRSVFPAETLAEIRAKAKHAYGVLGVQSQWHATRALSAQEFYSEKGLLKAHPADRHKYG